LPIIAGFADWLAQRMNPDLDRLQPYPFERLGRLLDGVVPPDDRARIRWSIGEPRHAPPAFALDALREAASGVGHYPATRGSPELREAIADWLAARFEPGPVDPDSQVLPVNGTREALFAFAQAVVDRAAPQPAVLLPNPFYQIYEGAALLAGAEPLYYPLDEAGAPDFSGLTASDWDRVQLLYVCTPGNPSGAVLDRDTLATLIEHAERHDFVIACDECYSEIHPANGPTPAGLLEAAGATGRDGYSRCVAFHSLSKRSNLPGLRSGFVAGDADVLAAFARYRTYHGCAMPPPAQAASIAAWRDEAHVAANRAAYDEKFDAVLDVLEGALEVTRPAAGFYLWPRTPVDDERFARELLEREGVEVLPGRYLGRDRGAGNPGAGRVRMALVAGLDECVEAARRVRRFMLEHRQSLEEVPRNE
jgi:N-succinyldiaminopimelate aminotransferase